MRVRPFRIALVAMSMIAGLFAAGAGAPASQQSYIVVLDAGTQNVGAVASDLAQAHGGQVGFVYEHAIKGFSITTTPQAAAALARNPRVAYVETDDPVSIDAQTVPTGVQRIFADGNENLDIDSTDDLRVDVDVAVIDTGVDFEHPDLNVVGGVDCANGGPFGGNCESGGDDDHYHGTHVAGTIAAIDNGDGVVGVAPGARIWSVKVLNQRGSGYTSWIVAGIDWVTAQGNIEVANMSLGGSGYNQAEYDAIQGAVNAGVAFAVAAGNSDADASNYSPAAFDNVLTVSALADFDGKAGGLGSPTCRSDQDDTLADFSNWGDAVQIAAPGVCILSTFPLEQGSYGTISGTSMASPHAAGALALLASSNNPVSAADVHNLYDQVINSGNFDWTDDSGDGIKERLLDVSDAGLFAPALVAGGGGDGGGDTNSPPSASFTSTCTDLTCDFTDTSSDDGTIEAWSWDFDGDGTTDSSEQNPSHAFAAAGTYTVGLTVTDNEGATGSTSQDVTVSDPNTAEVTLSAIDPNTAPAGTSVGVTITGTGFASGAAVTFENGSGPAPEASNIAVVDANTITATVTTKSGGPPRVRAWDVVVTNPDGSSGVLVGGFSVTP